MGDLRGAIRRVRHDLAAEITVLICAAVIVGLFIYVFRDFLTVKLQSLNAQAARIGATGFALLLLASVSVVIAAGRSRHRADPQSLGSLLLRLGEDARCVSTYEHVRSLCQIAVAYAVTWWIVWRWFVRWDLTTAIAIQVFALAALMGSARWRHVSIRAEDVRAPIITPAEAAGSRSEALFLWRWRQLIRRNRAARAAFIAAGALGLVIAACGLMGLPVIVAMALSIVLGTFAAMTLPFQLQEDLRYSWAEQGMGVSHAEIAVSYQKIGTLVALGAGLVACSTYLVGALVAGSPVTMEAAKLIATAAVGPALMPGLLFQIDPRRPLIQILVVFLAGLFIGTAVAAHWLGVALIPIAAVYAQRYQAGRFYRA